MRRAGPLQGLGARRYHEMSIITRSLESWLMITLPSSRTHIGHLEVFDVQWDGGMSKIAQGLFPEIVLTMESIRGTHVGEWSLTFRTDGWYLVAST